MTYFPQQSHRIHVQSSALKQNKIHKYSTDFHTGTKSSEAQVLSKYRQSVIQRFGVNKSFFYFLLLWHWRLSKFSCAISGIKYFLKYSKTEKVILNCNIFSQFYCFVSHEYSSEVSLLLWFLKMTPNFLMVGVSSNSWLEHKFWINTVWAQQTKANFSDSSYKI